MITDIATELQSNFKFKTILEVRIALDEEQLPLRINMIKGQLSRYIIKNLETNFNKGRELQWDCICAAIDKVCAEESKRLSKIIEQRGNVSPSSKMVAFYPNASVKEGMMQINLKSQIIGDAHYAGGIFRMGTEIVKTDLGAYINYTLSEGTYRMKYTFAVGASYYSSLDDKVSVKVLKREGDLITFSTGYGRCIAKVINYGYAEAAYVTVNFGQTVPYFSASRPYKEKIEEDQYMPKIALITGGTSGVGLELINILSQQNIFIHSISRDKE